MSGRLRFAPLVAGIAGLVAIWAELSPQRLGFPDTDDPALGLRFLAADPGAWAQAGIALTVTSIALLLTVLGTRERLSGPAGHPQKASPTAEAVTVIGVLAAAMLFGMAAVRMSGGPVRHVQGLDQGWGETAYLVTQFTGAHLFGQAGLLLLAAWIGGTALLAARRRSIPRVLAVLAVLPSLRLLVLAGPFDVLPGELWPLFMAAIPAAFLWLVLLALTRPIGRPAGPRALAVPGTAGL